MLYGQNKVNGTDRFKGILGPDGEPYRKDAPEAGFAVGHPIQFAAITSSGFRSYWHGHFDEAMKHSREDAIAMRNDPFLMALIQERKHATASLRWRIDVDDDRDPMQKAVKEGLTRILRRFPNFSKFCMYMLEAIWYGRYASQLRWGWKNMRLPSLQDPKQDEERRCLVIKKHQPINGDKIGHHWDGTPYILVNSAYAGQIKNAEIAPTTAGGMGLYLRGSWRWRYCVHTHEAVDADFFESSAADAIHGLGIRSVLFWLDWLRKEWLSNVADWCERTGLGIRLWYYQGNNPTSKTAVEKAARESNDRTNLFIPRYQTGANASEGVEFVDTSSTGADLLLRLQQHIEEIEERYVIGQALSGGQGAGDSLGGEGKSKLARDTKSQIIAYDAGNLGETLTNDILRPMQFWTYREPEAREVNARLVFAVDEPDPDKFLQAVKTFVELGGKVRMAEVQAVLGLSAPQEGDEVISLETINKAKQAGMPPGMGMPGMGGGMEGGIPDEDGGKDNDAVEAVEPFGGDGQEDERGGEPGTEDIAKRDDDDLDAGLEDIWRK